MVLTSVQIGMATFPGNQFTEMATNFWITFVLHLFLFGEYMRGRAWERESENSCKELFLYVNPRDQK